MSKIENSNRCFEVFKAMHDAIPKGSTHFDVMIAAEYFIANSIAISIEMPNVEKDEEEHIYETIVADIRCFVERINQAAEQEGEK